MIGHTGQRTQPLVLWKHTIEHPMMRTDQIYNHHLQRLKHVIHPIRGIKHVIHHFPRLLVSNIQVLYAPVHPSVTRTPHPTLRKIHLSFTSTPLGQHHRHRLTVTRILLGTTKHGSTGHVPPAKSSRPENHPHVRPDSSIPVTMCWSTVYGIYYCTLTLLVLTLLNMSTPCFSQRAFKKAAQQVINKFELIIKGCHCVMAVRPVLCTPPRWVTPWEMLMSDF